MLRVSCPETAPTSSFDVWKNSGESHAITVSSLGVRFGDSDIGWLRSKSRGAGWIQNRNCETERRLSGAILQETLSLPVFQRYPAGLDQLRVNKRRSGTKLLCRAERRALDSSPAKIQFLNAPDHPDVCRMMRSPSRGAHWRAPLVSFARTSVTFPARSIPGIRPAKAASSRSRRRPRLPPAEQPRTARADRQHRSARTARPPSNAPG
jgi:hypothetical protein